MRSRFLTLSFAVTFLAAACGGGTSSGAPSTGGTGSNAPADIDRARRVGAKGYITKDTIAASLVEAILAAAR